MLFIFILSFTTFILWHFCMYFNPDAKSFVKFNSESWIVSKEVKKGTDFSNHYTTYFDSVEYSTDLLVGITSYTSDFKSNEAFIKDSLDNQDKVLEVIIEPIIASGLPFRPYNFIVSTDFMFQHKTIKTTYNIASTKVESYHFIYKKHVIHIYSHITNDSAEKRLQLQKLFESFELT